MSRRGQRNLGLGLGLTSGRFIGDAGEPPAPPTLGAITLSNYDFNEDDPAGTVIGNIIGKTAGSTLAYTPNDGKLAFSGDYSQLLVGLTASDPGIISYQIVETLAGATNTPNNSPVDIECIAAAVTPDYTITDDASWTTVFANSDATLSNKNILVADGATLSPKSLTDRAFTSEVLLYWDGVGTQPVIESDASSGVSAFIIHNTDNLTVRNIKISQLDKSKPGIDVNGTNNDTNLWIDGNDIIAADYDKSISADYSSAAPLGGTHHGIYCTGGGNTPVDGLKITNNNIRNFGYGIAVTVKNGEFIVEGNDIEGHWFDGIQWQPDHSNQPSLVRIVGNTIHENGSRPTDDGEPHSDAGQAVFDFAGGANFTGIYICKANIIYCQGTTPTRGITQGIFDTAPANPGDIYAPVIGYNIIVSDGDQDGAALQSTRAKHGFYPKNVAVRKLPGDGANGGWRMQVGSADGEDNVMWACVAETYVTGADTLAVDNIGLTNSAASYEGVTGFSATVATDDPRTRQEIIDTFGGYLPEVNWTTFEIDVTNEHPGIANRTYSTQELDANVDTGWELIKGGPTTMALVVGSNLQYKLADDSAGTNETAWLTADDPAVARGKFMKRRVVASSDFATTVVGDFTLNGHTIEMETITRTEVPFNTTLWDQDWMQIATVGAGLSNSRKVTFICDWKQLNEKATNRILRLTAGPTFNFSSDSGGDNINWFVRDTGGTTAIATVNYSPGTNWVAAQNNHRYAVTVDLDAVGTTDDKMKVYWDGAEILTASKTINDSSGLNMWWSRAGTWEFLKGDGADFHDCEFNFLLLIPGVVLTREEINAIDGSNIDNYLSGMALYGTAAEANASTFQKGAANAFTIGAGSVVTDV